jgi:hypothetical protein
MKRIAFAAFLSLLVFSQAAAQMPMGGQSGSQPGSAQSGGMAPGGMMGGMMPGMMGGTQDPKMLGRMLQMRADMMRAMADVLAKHGKAIEEGK